jgi:hypothetical protein
MYINFELGHHTTSGAWKTVTIFKDDLTSTLNLIQLLPEMDNHLALNLF